MTSVTVDIHKWGIAIVDTPITFEQMDAVRSNHQILSEAWHVLHETKPRPNPMPTKAPPGFAIPERTRGIGLPETKGGPRRWWQWWRR